MNNIGRVRREVNDLREQGLYPLSDEPPPWVAPPRQVKAVLRDPEGSMVLELETSSVLKRRIERYRWQDRYGELATLLVRQNELWYLTLVDLLHDGVHVLDTMACICTRCLEHRGQPCLQHLPGPSTKRQRHPPDPDAARFCAKCYKRALMRTGSPQHAARPCPCVDCRVHDRKMCGRAMRGSGPFCRQCRKRYAARMRSRSIYVRRTPVGT